MSPKSKSGITSVGIIEDQKETREEVAFVINRSDGLGCRHIYGPVEAALEGIGVLPSQVVLVDIGLPGKSGIEGVRILRQRHPSMACVMFTVYKDDERIFQAMCAGACGYLLKNTAPARLVDWLREIAAGGAVMSPEVAVRVIDLFRKTQTPDQGPDPSYYAGVAPAEATDSRPSEQDRGRRAWRLRSHHRLSPSLDL